MVDPLMIHQQIEGHETFLAVDITEVKAERDVPEWTILFPERQAAIIINGLQAAGREGLTAEVEMGSDEPGPLRQGGLIIEDLTGGFFIEDGIAGFDPAELSISLKEMGQPQDVLLMTKPSEPEDDQTLYIEIRTITVVIDAIPQYQNFPQKYSLQFYQYRVLL